MTLYKGILILEDRDIKKELEPYRKYIIGRDEFQYVRLKDENGVPIFNFKLRNAGVSRKQAELYYSIDDSCFMIRDLKGKEGTGILIYNPSGNEYELTKNISYSVTSGGKIVLAYRTPHKVVFRLEYKEYKDIPISKYLNLYKENILNSWKEGDLIRANKRLEDVLDFLKDKVDKKYFSELENLTKQIIYFTEELNKKISDDIKERYILLIEKITGIY